MSIHRTVIDRIAADGLIVSASGGSYFLSQRRESASPLSRGGEKGAKFNIASLLCFRQVSKQHKTSLSEL